MPRKEYKRKISRTLKFSELFNAKGDYVGGGILNSTSHIEGEMWVEIMDDLVLDDIEGWIPTGRSQIHLLGTRKAFEELGVLFMALASYSPPEQGYSASLEFCNRESKPSIHLVVHLPVTDLESKPIVTDLRNIASGRIEKDGNVTDFTLPGKKPIP